MINCFKDLCKPCDSPIDVLITISITSVASEPESTMYAWDNQPLNELRRLGGGYGAAAICGGLAQGDAVIIKV